MSEIQAEVEFEEISDLYQSYMPFLKLGGLFVTTEQTYPMGTEIMLNVTLPDALASEQIAGMWYG